MSRREFFGLFGIAAALLVLRRLPGPRFLLAAAAAAILVFLPWSLYQKYSDPPGDRLLKMHLAGVIPPHPELKLSTMLAASYRNLGWNGVEDYKKENFKVLVDGEPWCRYPVATIEALFSRDPQHRGVAVMILRQAMFVRWLWSLDVLGLVTPLCLLPVVLRRPRSPEYRQACILWLCIGVTLIGWCLIMFGPGTTAVHQGCYFTEIAAFAAIILGLWTLSPRLAAVVAGVHILFSLAVYVVLTPPRMPGFATLLGPVNRVLAGAGVVAAAAFAYLLWSGCREVAEAGPKSSANSAVPDPLCTQPSSGTS